MIGDGGLDINVSVRYEVLESVDLTSTSKICIV